MHEPRQPTVIFGASVDINTLREGFNRGFADYPYNMQLESAAMQDYLLRSSITAEDCAVLMAVEQGRPQGVGAALLAVRQVEGWCGGLCVAPAYRGQGWGRRLMEQIKRRAVERGVSRLRLEVLVGNEQARSVYRQLGFQEQRELLIWERDPRQGALPLPYERLEEADPVQILQKFYRWHELTMPWQRRSRNLLKYLEQHNCIGLTIPAKDGAPVAYALARRSSGPAMAKRKNLHTGRRPLQIVSTEWRTGASDAPARDESSIRLHILDIAVDPNANLLDAGRPLVQALQLRYADAVLTLTNEPADSRLNPIFASFGFRVAERQYELTLDL